MLDRAGNPAQYNRTSIKEATVVTPRIFRDGFVHRGAIVYALQYTLATDPVSWSIVWLDEQAIRCTPTFDRPVPAADGNSQAGRDCRIIAVRNTLFQRYRSMAELGVEPGREVVG